MAAFELVKRTSCEDKSGPKVEPTVPQTSKKVTKRAGAFLICSEPMEIPIL